ncbi:hypothetical protein K503DRAFT_785271 [Rhizopogon vinicolor AM-OR11-026]|uniref:Uncharacterized protein n=1 Tax=Rhizopogon vinicolor AM-OR11-026 TaxID=1314800 RepID=A0A1B7MRF6_9AGAM|nr:hypothetical protein K503DRAFT_785271 [Rhizopogon vinicolor AM-OR11-026]
MYAIEVLDEMQQRIANQDASLLPETHALLCGFKVLVSTHGVSDRSVGGHGYSTFAGLGRFVVLLLECRAALMVKNFAQTQANDTSEDTKIGGRLYRLPLKRCLKIIPNAIGLTDAFGFLDWSLDSALGVSDGRVYEALWQRVQMEPMNKDEVTPAYAPCIRAMLQRRQGCRDHLSSKFVWKQGATGNVMDSRQTSSKSTSFLKA